MILRPRSGSQNHFVALRSGAKIRDQIFPFVETLQDFWRRMCLNIHQRNLLVLFWQILFLYPLKTSENIRFSNVS